MIPRSPFEKTGFAANPSHEFQKKLEVETAFVITRSMTSVVQLYECPSIFAAINLLQRELNANQNSSAIHIAAKALY
jgi:hypothetical protein